MNLAQLQTRLGQLGIQPKNVLRASLYIDYLEHAKTYFETTLAGTVPAGGFGPNYPFVENALRSANLLQELADVLDFFVAPAVAADLVRAFAPPPGLNHGGPAGWTYLDYFTNVILDANPATFAGNLTAFRNMYPIAATALQQLSANFEGNIFQACGRIIHDEHDLTVFYQDLYEEDFAFISLKRIKSTGSDFHKGGKQVLIRRKRHRIVSLQRRLQQYRDARSGSLSGHRITSGGFNKLRTRRRITAPAAPGGQSSGL